MSSQPTEDTLKILQLNMHRGKTADALLPQIAVEQKVDITIISEQHSRKSSGLWIEDDTATAAIWIPTPHRNRPKSHAKGNCFVWAQFDNLTIISCYLTPNDCIENFERKIHEIEDKIQHPLRIGC